MGCAAAPDAALDPNWDNSVTRNCTGISSFLHFSGNLTKVLSLPKSEETGEVMDDFSSPRWNQYLVWKEVS